MEKVNVDVTCVKSTMLVASTCFVICKYTPNSVLVFGLVGTVDVPVVCHIEPV